MRINDDTVYDWCGTLLVQFYASLFFYETTIFAVRCSIQVRICQAKDLFAE